MRAFSQQEQWILNKIAEIRRNKDVHPISLVDICAAFLKYEYIHVNLKRNDSYSIEFNFNRDKYPAKNQKKITKRKRKIETDILETIFLLEYLKENRLMFEMKRSKDDDFDIIKRKYSRKNHHPYGCDFDKGTQKFIVDILANKQYFIRQEFLDFVDNGFKTVEDIRFRKMQCATWIGIVIAFLIGLASILLNIFLK